MKDDEDEALRSASSALVGDVIEIAFDSLRLSVIPTACSCLFSSSSGTLTTSTSSMRGYSSLLSTLFSLLKCCSFGIESIRERKKRECIVQRIQFILNILDSMISSVVEFSDIGVVEIRRTLERSTREVVIGTDERTVNLALSKSINSNMQRKIPHIILLDFAKGDSVFTG